MFLFLMHVQDLRVYNEQIMCPCVVSFDSGAHVRTFGSGNLAWWVLIPLQGAWHVEHFLNDAFHCVRQVLRLYLLQF